MKKPSVVYLCALCGRTETKWLGRCPDCGGWNTFQEHVPAAAKSSGAKASAQAGPSRSGAVSLASVEAKEDIRIPSGFGELDRVMGGGFLRGSAVLLAGEPGIGKSTLMLQAAAQSLGRVLYISGEESAGQLKMRAGRLGVAEAELTLLTETRLEDILNALGELRPFLVIVDSIQTVYSEEAGAAGTVNQIRLCAHELIDWAKENNAVLFLVAHITKEGLIAGPKVLEHMVDTVLSYEQADGELRTLRVVKNRFGPVDEIGLFRMGEKGLSEIRDPESIFLVKRDGALPPGIAVAATFEGSRVLLIEVQCLVVRAASGVPRVFSEKIEKARVARLAAVLEKSIGLVFSDHDIYVNVAGGVTVRDTGVDLALACALYSARTGVPLPREAVWTGEVSLAGEVLPVRHVERRVKTARDLGYKRIVRPKKRGSDAAEPSTEKGGEAGADVVEAAFVGECLRDLK